MPCVQADATERQLLCELVALYTPEALSAGPAERPRRGKGAGGAGNGSAGPDLALTVLLELLALGAGGGAESVGAPVLRRAALGRVSAELYAAVPADQQARLLQARPALACVLWHGTQGLLLGHEWRHLNMHRRCFEFLQYGVFRNHLGVSPNTNSGLRCSAWCAQALLLAAAQDADAACRAAAHAALASAPLAANNVAPLLAATPQLSSAAGRGSGAAGKRLKKTPAKSKNDQQEAGQQPDEAFVAALELLQWHAGLQGAPELVAPLSGLLPGLLAGADAISEEDDEDAARCAAVHVPLQADWLLACLS